MAVTDQDQLTEVQLRLIEDSTFSSGLWSTTEVLGYFSRRQSQFLAQTGIVAAIARLDWIPGQPDHDLPEDWLATRLARWHDTLSGTATPLPQSDVFELDHLDQQNTLTPGLPEAIRDSDLETRRVTLAPPPANPGYVELLYIAVGELLDGSGIFFTVPDAFVPYLTYGVLADMLSKDGRGQDLLRARYCAQRYDEGTALAQSLLDGLA